MAAVVCSLRDVDMDIGLVGIGKDLANGDG